MGAILEKHAKKLLGQKRIYKHHFIFMATVEKFNIVWRKPQAVNSILIFFFPCFELFSLCVSQKSARAAHMSERQNHEHICAKSRGREKERRSQLARCWKWLRIKLAPLKTQPDTRFCRTRLVNSFLTLPLYLLCSLIPVLGKNENIL